MRGPANIGDETPIRILITKRTHPHVDEVGTLTGKVIKQPWGAEMAEVKLENCKHGVDACFISKGDAKQLAPDQSGETKNYGKTL